MTDPMFLEMPRFRERALCAETDPELFFPEKGGSPRRPKSVCNGDADREPCPARDECLAWALKNAEAGVWGGLSERERQRLRFRRTA